MYKRAIPGETSHDYVRADSTPTQLSRSRTLATVSDDPLDKKVEMTNWEKVILLAH